MSMKEKEQIKVFEQLVRKEIKQACAAELLDLSERQVRNKLRVYRMHGAVSLIHKNRGKPSKRRIFTREREHHILQILKDPKWHDFGPTFAAEKLYELHDIKVDRETLRKSMISKGLWKAHTAKLKKRKQRKRKRMFGTMIQLDGSKHKWFEDGCYYTLLVFIDDATSSIVHLEVVDSESLESVMLATRRYLEKHGRPRCFYTDFGSVFRVNLNNPDHEKLSQWERAMKELDIEVIHAHSPQAKGRVERSNRTHQDRLIKELRLLDADTLEKANAFLPRYIEKHNRLFSCEAADQTNAHRSIEGYDLDSILCLHEMRKVQNDYTILYKMRILQLTDQRNIQYKPRDEVMVKERFDSSLTITIRGFELEYKEIDERPKKPFQEKIYNNQNTQPITTGKRWNNHHLFKKRPYYYQPKVY